MKIFAVICLAVASLIAAVSPAHAGVEQEIAELQGMAEMTATRTVIPIHDTGESDGVVYTVTGEITPTAAHLRATFVVGGRVHTLEATAVLNLTTGQARAVVTYVGSPQEGSDLNCSPPGFSESENDAVTCVETFAETAPAMDPGAGCGFLESAICWMAGFVTGTTVQSICTAAGPGGIGCTVAGRVLRDIATRVCEAVACEETCAANVILVDNSSPSRGNAFTMQATVECIREMARINLRAFVYHDESDDDAPVGAVHNDCFSHWRCQAWIDADHVHAGCYSAWADFRAWEHGAGDMWLVASTGHTETTSDLCYESSSPGVMLVLPRTS